MGVFKGSITLSRFYVRGSVPKRFAQPYLEAIKLRAFVPLDPDHEDSERSGWCVAQNPLDLGLLHEQIFMGAYVVLGLRVDRWRVPRALLKAQLEEAVRAWKERTGREKINKKEKDELKFRIERKLRRRVVPSMRHVDVCWNLDKQQVLFWSRSLRAKEDFRVLFEQTFGLELDEDSPYMAAKHQAGEAQAERLLELTLGELVDAGGKKGS